MWSCELSAHWSRSCFFARSLWPAKGNYINVAPSEELFPFKLLPVWRFKISHGGAGFAFILLNSYKLFCGYSLPTQGICCYGLSRALLRQPLPQSDPCLAPVLFHFFLGHSFLMLHLFLLATPTHAVHFSFRSLLCNTTSPMKLEYSFLPVLLDTGQHSA